MRKKNLLLMGTLLFMSWITIQLYLFVHKPLSQRNKTTRTFPWFIAGGGVGVGGGGDDGAESDSNGAHANQSAAIKQLLVQTDSLHHHYHHDPDHDHHQKNSSHKIIHHQSNVDLHPHPQPQQNKNTNSNDGQNDGQDNNDDVDKKRKKQQLDFEKISNQVEQLEYDLSKQTKTAQVMIRLLKSIKKLAHSRNKTITEIISDRTLLKTLTDPPANQKPVICVLLFACNRVTVKRNLDQLFKYRNDADIFPIVVSQDCNHEPTRQIIKSYGDKLTYIQQPDQSDIVLKGKTQKKFKGYYKISRHYGWALNHTFNVLNYDTVLIVEDDLDIAPDFFEYFLALYPILRSDPSLYCISAWNDNGKQNLVQEDPTKLYRSDFFPGLGWMLTKDLWLEFQHKWPKAFWDDWIRQPEQRRNRACIRPELSRTKTFGKKGVSNGLFYEKHLKYIKLNEQFVPFTKMNLTFLLKENYDVEFIKQVYNSRLVSMFDVRKLPSVENDPSTYNTTLGPLESRYSLRIQYETKEQFKKAAKMFGLMDDFKSGVPRTGYHGTVGFWNRGYRIYLAPSPIWNGYNVTWK